MRLIVRPSPLQLAPARLISRRLVSRSPSLAISRTSRAPPCRGRAAGRSADTRPARRLDQLMGTPSDAVVAGICPRCVRHPRLQEKVIKMLRQGMFGDSLVEVRAIPNANDRSITKEQEKAGGKVSHRALDGRRERPRTPKFPQRTNAYGPHIVRQRSSAARVGPSATSEAARSAPRAPRRH